MHSTDLTKIIFYCIPIFKIITCTEGRRKWGTETGKDVGTERTHLANEKLLKVDIQQTLSGRSS